MSEIDDTVRAVAEVMRLVRDAPVRRVRLRVAEVSIDIECDPAAPPPVAQSAARSEADAVAGGDMVVVVAPLVGVFYRRPAPDRPPFVEPGQEVEAGQQVAIVEAMKMMNAIVAGEAGVVQQVLAEEGEVVEFDQPLLSIEPRSEAC